MNGLQIANTGSCSGDALFLRIGVVTIRGSGVDEFGATSSSVSETNKDMNLSLSFEPSNNVGLSCLCCLARA